VCVRGGVRAVAGGVAARLARVGGSSPPRPRHPPSDVVPARRERAARRARRAARWTSASTSVRRARRPLRARASRPRAARRCGSSACPSTSTSPSRTRSRRAILRPRAWPSSGRPRPAARARWPRRSWRATPTSPSRSQRASSRRPRRACRCATRAVSSRRRCAGWSRRARGARTSRASPPSAQAAAGCACPSRALAPGHT
jgi:hypothetical protein